MSNVKPGDLARVIADPQHADDGLSNVRKQVLVEGWYTGWLPRDLRHLAPFVTIEVMEPFYAQIGNSIRRSLVRAGTKCSAPARYLVPIDPPADTLDLLREEPLPGEKFLEVIQSQPTVS